MSAPRRSDATIADSSRRNRLRPSRAERARYTDALAQGVAEGRLTDVLYNERVSSALSATTFAELDDLVADLPFELPNATDTEVEVGRPRPRWLRTAALSAAGLLTAGAAFWAAVAVQGVNPFAGSGSGTLAEETHDHAEPPIGPWEPPPVAQELDAVLPMDSTTVRDALSRAEEAGLTDIEQIVLDEDATSVIGLSGEDELRQLYLRPQDVGTLSEARGSSGAYLDADGLDLEPDAAVEAARGASDAEPDQEVRSILVYRGDGSEERGGEEGNLVQVSFSGGPDVTLRADDLTPLW